MPKEDTLLKRTWRLLHNSRVVVVVIIFSAITIGVAKTTGSLNELWSMLRPSPDPELNLDDRQGKGSKGCRPLIPTLVSCSQELPAPYFRTSGTSRNRTEG